MFYRYKKNRLWFSLISFIIIVFSGAAQANSTNSHQPSKNVFLHARLTPRAADLKEGVTWRIYALPETGEENALKLITVMRGGTIALQLLPEQTYFVCATFGRAAALKNIVVKKNEPYFGDFILNAGAVRVTPLIAGGEGGDPLHHISLTLYQKTKQAGQKSLLILQNAEINKPLRLSAGQYTLIAKYGEGNAEKRGDFTVQAGTINNIRVKFKAATISFKLTHAAGGNALADTSWQIIDDLGNVVFKTVGAYVSAVLAEGHYVAVATNKEHIFHHDFNVVSGVNQQVEVLMQQQPDSFEDYSID